jgi:BCD family chlorophyll transporter-like MFS transporter
MAVPFTGYSVVYHVEMLFLFITLVAIGPLVQKNSRPVQTAELGLVNPTP